MFRKSCGRQIDNDSAFCSFCGTKQSTDLKPQVQTDTNQSISITQKTYTNDTNFCNSPTIDRQPKYDPTYEKENEAMKVGIILLIIALIFAIAGPIKFEDRESYGQFRAFTSIVSLILRIFITFWVVIIAKRQNRETFGWGLFAFLLPSIALITIGTKRKLFNAEEQKEILIETEKLKEKFKIIEDENGNIIIPSFIITENGETNDFKNGKSIILNIEFENLFRDMIYKRTKDGKYYFLADYKGDIYFSTKEDCVKAILFDRLKR
jgi:hypothetical protein